MKQYLVSEEEYNNLMHQLITSDNLVTTDKEKYLENKDLFWKTDNSKQIKMLESKKPVEVIAEGNIRYTKDDYYFKGNKKSFMDILIKNRAFGKKVKLILEVEDE